MTRQVSMCRPARWVMMALALMTVASAHATQDIQYSGTLIDTPPCAINDGQLIEIDFGEMGVNKVSEQGDDLQYGQLTWLDITCTGEKMDLFIRYLGNATDFDNAAVQTTLPDLGIQMQRTMDGLGPVAIGSGWVHEKASGMGGTSSFWAVPVKKAGAKLSGGDFTATAALQLEYP